MPCTRYFRIIGIEHDIHKLRIKGIKNIGLDTTNIRVTNEKVTKMIGLKIDRNISGIAILLGITRHLLNNNFKQ